MRALKLITLLEIVTAVFLLSLTSACTSTHYDAIYSNVGSSDGDEARFMFTNIETVD